MPSFWSEPQREARRNFKWLLYLGNVSADSDIGVPVWVVKNVSAPSVELQEGEHQFLNHTFYYPGIVKYPEIEVTLVDKIDVEISDRLIRRFVQSGYNVPDNANNAVQSIATKSQSLGALGTVRLEMLGDGEDGQDGKISFVLQGAWVKKIQFPQNLDYSSSDISEISLTLRYDFFKFAGVRSNGETFVPGMGG